MNLRRGLLLGGMIAALTAGAALAQLPSRPTTAGPNWQTLQQQADAAFDARNFQEAVDGYEKAVALARRTAGDPAVRGAAVAQMLNREGDAYLELERIRDAMAAFNAAFRNDPNPALVYFYLCLEQYVSGLAAAALSACQKAITYDPNYANAYFVTGLLLTTGAKQVGGKLMVPSGTREALQGYLILAPNGPHAGKVRAMLERIQ
jgi:tetratricopeptide (TPR) repeat protein